MSIFNPYSFRVIYSWNLFDTRFNTSNSLNVNKQSFQTIYRIDIL